MYLLPFSLWLGWKKNGVEKDLFVLVLFTSILFLITLSFSQTKLIWYDAPIYPCLAILIAMVLNTFVKTISAKTLKVTIIPISVVIALMIAAPNVVIINPAPSTAAPIKIAPVTPSGREKNPFFL